MVYVCNFCGLAPFVIADGYHNKNFSPAQWALSGEWKKRHVRLETQPQKFTFYGRDTANLLASYKTVSYLF